MPLWWPVYLRYGAYLCYQGPGREALGGYRSKVPIMAGISLNRHSPWHSAGACGAGAATASAPAGQALADRRPGLA
jgi:hypothetical protein